VASAVRREPFGPRPDSQAEWPPTHHRRRDASSLWLVRQRRILASVVTHAHRRPLDQPDRAPGARCLEGCRRTAAQRVSSTARGGKPFDVPVPGLHHDAVQLSGRHGRERPDAANAAAASRRRGLPAVDCMRQRCQPAARARYCSRARDGNPDVDWGRPTPDAPPAADREWRSPSPAASSVCCSHSVRFVRSWD
jgi:hypothetical protein